jgi:Ca2+-binding EF-hand superfamily protein
VNDIQKARYDRCFNAYVGSDGYLSEESFTAHTKTLAELRHQDVDSPAIRALVSELHGWWEQISAAADTDGDGRISRDEWYAFAEVLTENLRQVTEAGRDWPLEPWIRFLYGVIDANGDGLISKQEYADWLAALGLAADTDIDAAFAGFDKNQDGSLSWEEFAECSRQFWMTFDPSVPGHRWIGP